MKPKMRPLYLSFGNLSKLIFSKYYILKFLGGPDDVTHLFNFFSVPDLNHLLNLWIASVDPFSLLPPYPVLSSLPSLFFYRLRLIDKILINRVNEWDSIVQSFNLSTHLN